MWATRRYGGACKKETVLNCILIVKYTTVYAHTLCVISVVIFIDLSIYCYVWSNNSSCLSGVISFVSMPSRLQTFLFKKKREDEFTMPFMLQVVYGHKLVSVFNVVKWCRSSSSLYHSIPSRVFTPGWQCTFKSNGRCIMGKVGFSISGVSSLVRTKIQDVSACFYFHNYLLNLVTL